METRLALDASKTFATLFRSAMVECGFPSVYSLALIADFPRATIHRWLSGRVRTPISGASHLIDILCSHSGDEVALHDLRDLLRFASSLNTQEQLLCAELRARGVPVQRTLDALRAANVFPAKGVGESVPR